MGKGCPHDNKTHTMSSGWPGPGTPLNEVEQRLEDPHATDLNCFSPFLKETYSLTQVKTDSGPTYLEKYAFFP